MLSLIKEIINKSLSKGKGIQEKKSYLEVECVEI